LRYGNSKCDKIFRELMQMMVNILQDKSVNTKKATAFHSKNKKA
jgi:hypothetical protein